MQGNFPPCTVSYTSRAFLLGEGSTRNCFRTLRQSAEPGLYPSSPGSLVPWWRAGGSSCCHPALHHHHSQVKFTNRKRREQRDNPSCASWWATFQMKPYRKISLFLPLNERLMWWACWLPMYACARLNKCFAVVQPQWEYYNQSTFLKQKLIVHFIEMTLIR